MGPWQELSVGYGRNNTGLRIGQTMEWMVCHSNIKYLHQSLLTAIINFLSLSDKDNLSPGKSGCTILPNLPVFEIVK